MTHYLCYVTISLCHTLCQECIMCLLMQVRNSGGLIMEFSAIISAIISACREEGAEQEVIDLLPGNQYILPYRPISSLVHSGAAKLI